MHMGMITLKKKKNFQNFTNLLLYDVHFSNGFSASFFLAQGLPTVWSGLGRQIDIQMCAWLLPGPARGRALQKDPGVTRGLLNIPAVCSVPATV